MTENAGGALTTYSWDWENRIIGVSSPTGVETYSYSADGMREEKANSSGTIYYVRDGENVLIETDANLITQAHYTDFPGMWGGLTSERRGATSSFYGFDQQANARNLVSPAGAITDDYLYKAFGEERAVSGATVNSLRFGGQVGYWRDEAERVYVRARNLRTDMGRWISRDPIGFDGGDWNLYGYVGNEPVWFNDPSGLIWHWVCCLFGLSCCHSHPAKKSDKMKEVLQQLSEGQINNLAKFHGYGEECEFLDKVNLMVEAFNILKNEGKEMDAYNFCKALAKIEFNSGNVELGFNSNGNTLMFNIRCEAAYDRANGLPTIAETLSSWLNWYYGGVLKSLS